MTLYALSAECTREMLRGFNSQPSRIWPYKIECRENSV